MCEYNDEDELEYEIEDELEVTYNNPDIQINDALKQLNIIGEILNYEVIQIFNHINIDELTEDDNFSTNFNVGDNIINFEATIRYLYEDENDYDKVTGKCIVVTKMSCGDECIEVDIELIY